MTETLDAVRAAVQLGGIRLVRQWLLVDEQAFGRSPMGRVHQPKTSTKLVR